MRLVILAATLATLTSSTKADILDYDVAVRAACPDVEGVASSGRIDFTATASKECRDAATAVQRNLTTLMAIPSKTKRIDPFDPSTHRK